MEDQIERLVEKTWKKYKDTPPSQRLLIAISGIPGSGKTTLASVVADRLNKLHDEEAPGCSSIQIASYIPMDGYHFSRAHLSSMSDPVTAHARRGAAFTFDSSAFLALIREVRKPLLPETTTIHAPSFDHAKKDPVYDDIPIAASSRVLIFEGNYLSLAKGDWKEAASLMDELWFVNVDFDVAKKRLVERHVRSGIAKDEEEAEKRVVENDLVNGQEIIDHQLEVQERIESLEDEAWAREG